MVGFGDLNADFAFHAMLNGGPLASGNVSGNQVLAPVTAEVPLEFLIAPENHRLESAMYKGRMRQYYAIPYGRRYIWGATAGMLVTFTRVLAHARGMAFLPPIRMAPDSG